MLVQQGHHARPCSRAIAKIDSVDEARSRGRSAAMVECTILGLFGCSVVRLFGCSVVRLFGYSVVRLFGESVGRWISGSVGCVDDWLDGGRGYLPRLRRPRDFHGFPATVADPPLAVWPATCRAAHRSLAGFGRSSARVCGYRGSLWFRAIAVGSFRPGP